MPKIDTEQDLDKLRDHFAGIVLQSCLISQEWQNIIINDEQNIFEFSYKMADGMLKAREKKDE